MIYGWLDWHCCSSSSDDPLRNKQMTFERSQNVRFHTLLRRTRFDRRRRASSCTSDMSSSWPWNIPSNKFQSIPSSGIEWNRRRCEMSNECFAKISSNDLEFNLKDLLAVSPQNRQSEFSSGRKNIRQIQNLQERSSRRFPTKLVLWFLPTVAL